MSASAASFAATCANCLASINPLQDDAFILSCGDFQCSSCTSADASAGALQNCKGCGKIGVKIASLRKNVPPEVTRSTIDILTSLDGVKGALNFQVKYYKQTIRRLVNRILAADREISELHRYCSFLLSAELFEININSHCRNEICATENCKRSKQVYSPTRYFIDLLDAFSFYGHL